MSSRCRPSARASIIKVDRGIYFAFLAAADFFLAPVGDFGSEVRNKATCSGDGEAQSLGDCSCKEGCYVREFFLTTGQQVSGCQRPTDHGDHSARPGHALHISGNALIQALIILLHPFDDQCPVTAQCDACNGAELLLSKCNLCLCGKK